MTCAMTVDAMNQTIDNNEAWRAVLARDRSFDGRFVTGVLSTGIYCRPSCAARHPRRENVRFFAHGAAARAAGLRPCRRCSPDDVSRDERAVLQAIAAIKAAGQPLALSGLAADNGYSPAHFQRIFTRATGLSPAAYARALRMERARAALSDGGRVTDAVYDAGFNAPSRFYEASGQRLGMAPSAWRNGGRGVTIHWASVSTSLGRMLVAATDKGVCRLSFDEGREALETRFPHSRGRLARIAQDPPGRDAQLRRDRRRSRQAHGRARGGERQWREQRRGADPLPPGDPLGWLAGRLCLWVGDQGGTAEAGAAAESLIAADPTPLGVFRTRFHAFESIRSGQCLGCVPGDG
jgi:methylphosphotriester-DNA--protein-cysteine methyltransferase